MNCKDIGKPQWLVIWTYGGNTRTGFFWDYDSAKSYSRNRAAEGQDPSIFRFSEQVEATPSERDFFEEGIVQGVQEGINESYNSWKHLAERVKVLEGEALTEELERLKRCEERLDAKITILFHRTDRLEDWHKRVVGTEG